MPAEHRAIILLLALAAGGQAVRYVLSRPGDAPGAVQILAAVPSGAPLAHRDSAVQLARPLAAGERLDVNRAPAAELARLPRVGPSLAKAIVAYRAAHGPFGGLVDLDAVPGVGPGLLAGLAGSLTFSGGSGNLHGEMAGGGGGAGTGTGRPVDLNSATAAELDRLPGIGPAKAQAIVTYRDKNGPFGSVADLARVPGVSAALIGRLQDLAVAR